MNAGDYFYEEQAKAPEVVSQMSQQSVPGEKEGMQPNASSSKESDLKDKVKRPEETLKELKGGNPALYKLLKNVYNPKK